MNWRLPGDAHHQQHAFPGAAPSDNDAGFGRDGYGAWDGESEAVEEASRLPALVPRRILTMLSRVVGEAATWCWFVVVVVVVFVDDDGLMCIIAGVPRVRAVNSVGGERHGVNRQPVDRGGR